MCPVNHIEQVNGVDPVAGEYRAALPFIGAGAFVQLAVATLFDGLEAACV